MYEQEISRFSPITHSQSLEVECNVMGEQNEEWLIRDQKQGVLILQKI